MLTPTCTGIPLYLVTLLFPLSWCTFNNIIDTQNHFSRFRGRHQDMFFQLKRFTNAQVHHITNFTGVHVNAGTSVARRMGSS